MVKSLSFKLLPQNIYLKIKYDSNPTILKNILNISQALIWTKKCIRLSDAPASQKIFRKIYFVVKPLKKVLIRGGEILSVFFMLKVSFLLISGAVPIF